MPINSQAQKILNISAKKDPSAAIGISGIESSVVEKISPVGMPKKSYLVIDGLENPAEELCIITNQIQLDDSLLQDKENHLKNTLKNTVIKGNRIAEQLANSVLDAGDLGNVIGGTQEELSVRGAIANASKPQMAIHIDGEPPINTGGGLAVPKQLVKGAPVSLNNCLVIDVSRRGWVKIRKQAIDEFEDAATVDFHVDRKSKEFNLLNAARIFDCKIDCQLIKFEKVSNGQERFELLAISNQKDLLESLIEKLKYWEDMS